MRQITFILLCCIGWSCAAARIPFNYPLFSQSASSAIEQPDFIVADILGVHGTGAPLAECNSLLPCIGSESAISNNQVLYLPVTPPGSTEILGYKIKFAYTENPAIQGQFIAWLTCKGEVTISNICAINGMRYTFNSNRNNFESVTFTVENTPFLFKITEITNPNKGFLFEYNACVASYCKVKIPRSCDPSYTGNCNIEITKECRQSDSGIWTQIMKLYYNGAPIQNINDPNCCVTWEYVNGIPTIPCPRPNGLPNMNYTPMSLPEGRHYKVTITCGENCSYSEEGIVGCTPVIPKTGGTDNRSNDSNESNTAVANAPKIVSIFPNPANNELAIRIHPNDTKSISYTLLLFDALGRQVLAHPLANESRWQILDISSFTPGAYTWRLIDSNGERPLQAGKLLVHH